MLSIAELKAIVSANMVEALVERGRELSLIQTLLRLVTLGLANPRGASESHHLIAYTLASLVTLHTVSGSSAWTSKSLLSRM